MFWKQVGRKQLRLSGYDYSRPGKYYLTLVTHSRRQLFGEVRNNEMILSPFGKIVHRHWKLLFYRYPHIHIDEFVVMPDHMHGIIEIAVEAGFSESAKPASTRNRKLRRTISEIVRGFKTATATSINIDRKTSGLPV